MTAWTLRAAQPADAEALAACIDAAYRARTPTGLKPVNSKGHIPLLTESFQRHPVLWRHHSDRDQGYGSWSKAQRPRTTGLADHDHE